MPVGVEVLTSPAASGGGLARDAAATYFVVGLAERGRTDQPVLVRSMTEYERHFGARVTYGTLHDDLSVFFAEGGTRAFVKRIVGDAATTGTLTLQDRGGVPASTLRIDALGAGAWSSRVTIEVTNGLFADTFNINVYLDGSQVESFSNLTDPAAAVTTINAGSQYVAATNLGSTNTPPANNPAVLAPTALGAGNDDRTAVVAATYITGLTAFTQDFGPGAVSIPGQPHSTVGTSLIAHARDYRRIALLAPAAGSSVTTATSAAGGLRTAGGAEHAGLFYPWVQVPDGRGGVRTISPEGYVAGIRARAIQSVGTWRAPAGEAGVSRSLVGTETLLTREDVNNLNDGAVNPIRIAANSIRLYGWRSLSADETNYKFLHYRDLMNDVALRAETQMERYVFRTIDGRGHLFTEIETELAAILEPIRQAGGLYERTDESGVPVDNGYSIETGPAVNPAEQLANGEVRAAVAIRVSPVGELIRVTIAKVTLQSEL